MKKFLKYLSLGLLSTLMTATPGLSAERISFFYPPFGEFSLSVESLEIFAKEGKINNELEFYASRANPQQLAQLRELLQMRFSVTPTLVSQVTYSPIGEQVLQRLGELVLTDSRRNGFYALRGALILAAADPEGLTVVNFLRKFPTETLRLNFTEGLKIVADLSELLKKRDQVVDVVQQEAVTEAANSPFDFAGKPDLRSPGTWRWDKKSLTLNDSKRDRQLPVDLYLPAPPQNIGDRSSSPLIVISHGIASDRYAFVYLAEHLASHGFAVAVLEHPGSNALRVQQYFIGLAGPPEAQEFIDRPLDIKFLLDDLQRLEKVDPVLQGKLNFQQVGVIGHSFGGYTALTLAGAKINFDQLRQDCDPNNTSSFNLSLILQCQATGLPQKDYQLADDRIKVILVVNPIGSSMFGKQEISKIPIPVMLVAGSQDIFAPPVFEQIRPFTWIADPNKHLALIENATHFSAIAEPTPENDILPVPPGLLGPSRGAVYGYLKALSVAFLETHLRQRPEYRSYLQPSYATFISQPPLNLSLLQSQSSERLIPAVNNSIPEPNQQPQTNPVRP
ncbi:MAG: alpha/beta hydrolase [Goleter apudmare HA4340-LM2]|jgi:predicted dienelactone hydrolase|nr:alpha/beta hydrolase [Goleter apudmare HA4340-LM2]